MASQVSLPAGVLPPPAASPASPAAEAAREAEVPPAELAAYSVGDLSPMPSELRKALCSWLYGEVSRVGVSIDDTLMRSLRKRKASLNKIYKVLLKCNQCKNKVRGGPRG